MANKIKKYIQFSHIPDYTDTGIWLPVFLTGGSIPVLMNNQGTRKRLQKYLRATRSA